MPTASLPAAAPEAVRASVGLRVEDVADLAALARLEPEWQRLWARCPRATPFQSPHWLLPWWQHIGQGRLATLAVRSAAGELVALAPLYVHADPGSGRRHLFPLGIATTDWLDILVDPAWEAEALPLLVAALAERSGSWDLLEFPRLAESALLLRARWPVEWRCERMPDEPSPMLPLPRRSAGAPLPVPPGMAANLRTARNKAARMGQVALETADGQALPGAMADLLRLHGQRWSQRGEPGVLGEGAVQRAHAAAAPRLHAAGLLRLHVLRLDGMPAAVLYCLADRTHSHSQRCYYYIGGFDPGLRALSPGTLLVAHAIEQAAAEGLDGFDFLRGAEPYKYRWGARDQPAWTLRVHPADVA